VPLISRKVNHVFQEKMMFPIKRLIEFSLCIFTLSAFLGCATPQSNPGATPLESPSPGSDVVYHPKMQPGMTFESAKSDLKTTESVTFILDSTGKILAFADRLAVFDDRMETNYHWRGGQSSSTLYYHNLLHGKIVVEVRNNGRDYCINLPEFPTIHSGKLSNAQKTADALFFIQQQIKKAEEERNHKLASFEQRAAQYRALKTKPPVTEEQRRLVVQANAFNQQRNYGKAIEQYLKAIELDPTSYPGAYFNLALLSAQVNSPLSAIFYMKHYLLLEPKAADARSAQDKIYEWEIMLQK
jgi:tetratricopeptide (TPR) repeat protein